MRMISKRISAILGAALLLASCATDDGWSDKPNIYGDYVAGQHARYVRDTSAAATYYHAALAQDPDNPLILRRAFSLLLTDGRYKESLTLSKRLSEVPGSSGNIANILLTIDGFRKRRYGSAREALESVNGSGFDTLVKPLAEAWSQVGSGNGEAAIAAMEPLADMRVFVEYYKSHLAYLHDWLGNKDEADAAYKALLGERVPSSFYPVVSYGAFLVRHDRRNEAETLFSNMIKKFPQNGYMRRQLKRVQAGDKPEVVARTPSAGLALGFARAAAQLGRDNARNPASLYARFATFLDPDNGEAQMLLGSLLSRDGLRDAAIGAFAEVDKDSYFWVSSQIRSAQVLSAAERVDEAIVKVAKVLDLRPQNKDALTALGDLYRQQEKYDAALEYYDRAIATIDEERQADWFLYFSRGVVYEAMDLWPPAEADFKQALVLQPDEPQVLNYLGYSWIDRGMNIEPAKAMIEKAVEQRPNDGYIIDSLGWVLYLLGDYEKATEQLERAIRLQPGDPTINDHLGDAYWKVGRKIEARFQWQHALDHGAEEAQVALIKEKLTYGLSFAEAGPTPDGN